MKIIPVFCFPVILFTAASQDLVVNGGFETYSSCPSTLGHFYTQAWGSPVERATPDLYATCALKNDPAHPSSFWSQVTPYKGEAHAGIVVFKEENKYREYMATRLTMPLQENVEYTVEMAVAIPYLSHLQASRLQVLFSERIPIEVDGWRLDEEPSLEFELDSLRSDGSWLLIKGTYLAEGGETCLTIGNFSTDKQTVSTVIKGRNSEEHKGMHNLAYLCIDEVKVYVTPEEEEIAVEPPAEEETIPLVLQTIVLQNLAFATNDAALAEEGIAELDELVDILTDQPEQQVSIQGHTDNTGSPERNLELSRQRAESVATYLTEHGIGPDRITTAGHGDAKPIATNDTETGRALNRRVEIRLFVDAPVGDGE